MLPNNKTTSLFTGEVADFPEEHKNFFFVVPKKQDLIKAINVNGYKIDSLSYIDEREWQIVISKDKEDAFTNADLHLLLINTLNYCLENE